MIELYVSLVDIFGNYVWVGGTVGEAQGEWVEHDENQKQQKQT